MHRGLISTLYTFIKAVTDSMLSLFAAISTMVTDWTLSTIVFSLALDGLSLPYLIPALIAPPTVKRISKTIIVRAGNFFSERCLVISGLLNKVKSLRKVYTKRLFSFSFLLLYES